MRKFIPFALALVTLSAGFALGKKPAPTPGPENPGTRGTIVGVVRQIGNAPHIELVVTGTSDVFEGTADYHVMGGDYKKLEQFSDGTIKVTGLLSKDEIKLAGSGGRTRVQYFVTIESIEKVQ